jgi:dephospho-CoA kinase
VAPGSEGLAQVVERFGPGVRLADGTLDRAAMAGIVFADAAALADLESIVHPLVARLRDQRLAACVAPVAVIEAIKLIEAGFAAQCQRVWVVTAPAELRLQRLIERRGMDPADAEARLAAQSDGAEKLALADEVIVNDGSLTDLRARVEDAWGLLPQAGPAPRATRR